MGAEESAEYFLFNSTSDDAQICYSPLWDEAKPAPQHLFSQSSRKEIPIINLYPRPSAQLPWTPKLSVLDCAVPDKDIGKKIKAEGKMTGVKSLFIWNLNLTQLASQLSQCSRHDVILVGLP